MPWKEAIPSRMSEHRRSRHKLAEWQDVQLHHRCVVGSAVRTGWPDSRRPQDARSLLRNAWRSCVASRHARQTPISQSDRYAGGAISTATMPPLAEHGYKYMGNSLAYDVPHYWVYDPDGPKSILVMPYYYHFDDQFFLLFPAKGTGLERGDSLARNWRAEMDAQYRRGRSFSMVLCIPTRWAGGIA